MDIVDHYFYLSDFAGKDEEKLTELCGLFSKDAIIESNGGDIIRGEKEFVPFFKEFFSRNDATRHLWNVIHSPNQLTQVNWGVVCRRKTGKYFTLTGSDYFKLENNKITHLKIVGNIS